MPRSVTFWLRVTRIADLLQWRWLAGYARVRRFRAELARQKLDVARVRAHSGASDDTDAAIEEGIAPKVPRVRRARPPKRSATSA